MKGRTGRKGPMSTKGTTSTMSESISAAYGGGSGKTAAEIEGPMMHKRYDRPGRKSGGRVGADKSPLSSAAKMSPAAKTDC